MFNVCILIVFILEHSAEKQIMSDLHKKYSTNCIYEKKVENTYSVFVAIMENEKLRLFVQNWKLISLEFTCLCRFSLEFSGYLLMGTATKKINVSLNFPQKIHIFSIGWCKQTLSQKVPRVQLFLNGTFFKAINGLLVVFRIRNNLIGKKRN